MDGGPQAWIDLLTSLGGPVAMLGLFIWLLLNQRVVPHWYIEDLKARITELKAENVDLRKLLDRYSAVADRTTTIAEKRGSE